MLFGGETQPGDAPCEAVIDFVTDVASRLHPQWTKTYNKERASISGLIAKADKDYVKLSGRTQQTLELTFLRRFVRSVITVKQFCGNRGWKVVEEKLREFQEICDDMGAAMGIHPDSHLSGSTFKL